MAYQPKSYRKFLATSVATALVATAVAPAASADHFSAYPDLVEGAWYDEAVSYALEMGYLQGFPDGTFQPGASITRAQAATIFANILDLDTTGSDNLDGFTDLVDGAWYEGAISAAVEAGLFQGYPDNTFRPGQDITRGEFAVLMVRAYDLELNEDGEVTNFPDVSANSFAREAIEILASNGIINGLPDGTFGVGNDVTRAQGAAFIYNTEVMEDDEDAVTVTNVAADVDGSSVTVTADVANADEATISITPDSMYSTEDLEEYAASLELTLDELVALLTTDVDVEDGMVSATFDLLPPGDHTATVEADGVSASVDFTVEAPEVVDPEVTSLSFLNSKQVQVVFSTPVDEDTVLGVNDELINATFTPVGTATDPDTITAELSEDGTTLLLTADNVFDGQYVFATNDQILSANGEELPEFSELFTADDQTAPSVVSSSAVGRTSTSTFYVTFDEPVDASGALASVNGTSGTVTVDPNNRNRVVVTSSTPVNTGTTANVSLTNIRDFNNNFTAQNPLSVSVSVVADTTAPVVQNVQTTGEQEVTVTFSKPVDVASFANRARLVTGGGTVTPLTATAGDNANTVVLSGNLPAYNTSYTASLVIDAGVLDRSGNALGTQFSQSVVFNRDVTAPTLTNVTHTNSVVRATFSENVTLNTGQTVTLINQATGEATQVNLDTANASVSNNVLRFDAALEDGTYQLRLPAGTVQDTAITPNQLALSTANFNVVNSQAADTTRPVINNGTIVGPTNPGGAPGVDQVVTYTVTDTGSGINLATVRNVSNYSFDGQALPAGTFVTTNITGGTVSAPTTVVVSVNIPSSQITETETANFTISGIRDNAGNSIQQVANNSVTLYDGVAPRFTAATVGSNNTSLLLTFSEAVTNVDEDDFDVEINGEVIPSSAFDLVESQTDNNTFVGTVTASWANDVQVNGQTRDVLYIESGDAPGFDNDDLVIAVAPETTVGADAPSATVNLNASYITSLNVTLVDDATDRVRDTQGNLAVFGNEIVIR